MTKKELNYYLDIEFSLYFKSKGCFLKSMVFREKEYFLWKLQKCIRKQEYYSTKSSIYEKLMYFLYSRKVNTLRMRLGIEIWHSSFKEGLLIYHPVGIVVNGLSKIGRYCCLHGDNCIGNNGITTESPVIGDNCDIGVGAKIIGPVRLGNNITIGAGAVVNKSFMEDNLVLAGIPAKIIRKKSST